jgi:hypothetical protein
VRPEAVADVLPEVDHGMGFFEPVEDLLAQAIVAQLAVEFLIAPILPWRAKCDVLDLRAGFGDPLAQRPQAYLRARQTLHDGDLEQRSR